MWPNKFDDTEGKTNAWRTNRKFSKTISATEDMRCFFNFIGLEKGPFHIPHKLQRSGLVFKYFIECSNHAQLGINIFINQYKFDTQSVNIQYTIFGTGTKSKATSLKYSLKP